MLLILMLVVSSVLVGCASGVESSLSAFIAAKEEVAARAAAHAEIAHAGRCAQLSSAGRCSVAACANTLPGSRGFSTCTDQLGVDPGLCGESCPGLVRSLDESVVRFPRAANDTDIELRAFTTSSAALTATFRQSHRDGAASRSWQYIAHTTGVTRIFPGAPQARSLTGGCSDYDPRLRPWYSVASSGPKDVVLILDKSASMGNATVGGATRMQVLKAAVHGLLDTLTHSDFVTIVPFDTYTRSFTERLVKADRENLQRMKQDVDELSPFGGSYAARAFDRAFSVLKDSIAHQAPRSSSGGPRVFICLTDGDNSDGYQEVLSRIATQQATLERPAHIMTHSISADANDTLPRAIACGNRGVWSRIADGENALDKLPEYYQFLADGVENNVPRWSTPYTDALGMGELVTVARAVYDRSTSVPLLVSVVGVDVLLSELQRFASYDAVVGELIARSANVSNFSVTECQLQRLRDLSGYTCPSLQPCNMTQEELPTLPRCPSAVTASVNDLLCEGLDRATMLGFGNFRTTGQMSCCSGCSPTDVSGASRRAALLALSLTFAVFLTVV